MIEWDLSSADVIGTTARFSLWEGVHVSVHISGRPGSVCLGHETALPELALAIIKSA